MENNSGTGGGKLSWSLTCPINYGIGLLHSFDGAVTIEGVEKSDVGKGKVGIDFFEAHSSSRLIDLKELWQKN